MGAWDELASERVQFLGNLARFLVSLGSGTLGSRRILGKGFRRFGRFRRFRRMENFRMVRRIAKYFRLNVSEFLDVTFHKGAVLFSMADVTTFITGTHNGRFPPTLGSVPDFLLFLGLSVFFETSMRSLVKEDSRTARQWGAIGAILALLDVFRHFNKHVVPGLAKIGHAKVSRGSLVPLWLEISGLEVVRLQELLSREPLFDALVDALLFARAMVEFEPFALACLLLLGMAFLSCLLTSFEHPSGLALLALGFVDFNHTKTRFGDPANALFMPAAWFHRCFIVLGPFLGPKWFRRVLPASFLVQEPRIGLVDLEEAFVGLVTTWWCSHDGRRLERYR
jgi:hypothetical protein